MTHWRTDACFAAERGEQYNIVLHELDIAVSFIAGNNNSFAREQARELLLNYYIPGAL